MRLSAQVRCRRPAAGCSCRSPSGDYMAGDRGHGRQNGRLDGTAAWTRPASSRAGEGIETTPADMAGVVDYRGEISVTADDPEAVAAVDRLAVGRSEGNLRRAAASAASGGEHLPWPAVESGGGISGGVGPALRTRRLARAPAGRAALRIGEAALGVEVLLAGGKYELLAAVGADQNLVRVHENPWTPLSSRLVRVLAARVRGPVCRAT